MLERITWSAYASVMGTLVAIYYIILFLLLLQKGAFSRNKFKGQNLRGQDKSPAPEPLKVANYDPAGNGSRPRVDSKELQIEEDNSMMPLVHELMEEFKRFIVGISESSFVKEEVIMGIQVIVQNYNQLQPTQYYKSINDYLKYECESCCSIALNEDDINRIWLG